MLNIIFPPQKGCVRISRVYEQLQSCGFCVMLLLTNLQSTTGRQVFLYV